MPPLSRTTQFLHSTLTHHPISSGFFKKKALPIGGTIFAQFSTVFFFTPKPCNCVLPLAKPVVVLDDGRCAS